MEQNTVPISTGWAFKIFRFRLFHCIFIFLHSVSYLHSFRVLLVLFVTIVGTLSQLYWTERISFSKSCRLRAQTSCDTVVKVWNTVKPERWFNNHVWILRHGTFFIQLIEWRTAYFAHDKNRYSWLCRGVFGFECPVYNNLLRFSGSRLADDLAGTNICKYGPHPPASMHQILGF